MPVPITCWHGRAVEAVCGVIRCGAVWCGVMLLNQMSRGNTHVDDMPHLAVLFFFALTDVTYNRRVDETSTGTCHANTSSDIACS